MRSVSGLQGAGSKSLRGRFLTRPRSTFNLPGAYKDG